MSRSFFKWFALAVLVQWFAVIPVAAQGPQHPTRADAKALAGRVDKLINERLLKESIKAGLKSDYPELIRRLYIDLTGRIPSLVQTQDFLDNEDPAKFEQTAEDLVNSQDFANNLTHYYRSVMLAGNNNIQAQALQFQFEGWLRERLMKNTGFDKLTRELISTTPVNQNKGGGSALAFFQANENKPENLAGATARIFLGVKIECAQCHKHPFAKWTRQQFWEYAAFFANTAPQKGIKGAKVDPNVRQITIPDTNDIARAKFITGEEPQWKNGQATRDALADWMTSPKNPYFAKASVDHLWQYLFGVSLAEPILEPTDDSPPAFPELLDVLAQAFADSGFDVKFIMQALVLTDAYQRVSTALNAGNKEEIQHFARMPIRGMMPEQLFDSFAEATVYRQDLRDDDANRQPNIRIPTTPRQLFLAKFSGQDKRIETQTSILQALYVMNGKFLSERVSLENNEALRTIATAATPTSRRVWSLYMLVLSRPPRQEETERLVGYIESGGPTHDTRQAIVDIYWALLNSSEFMLNH
jgi:hypothetical protein